MKKNNYDFIYYVIGICTGGFLIYALCNIITGYWGSDLESIGLLLVLLLVCVGSLLSGRSYSKKNKKYAEQMKIAQKKQEEAKHKNICKAFYNECAKNKILNIEDFQKTIVLEKAKLLAAALGIREEEIEKFFVEGEQLVESDKVAKEKQEKLAVKNRYMQKVQEINKNSKYKDLHGRDKTIRMLEEMISAELSQMGNAEKIVDGIADTEKAFSKSEVAWGWTGGLAAGIAGGAAGLAAAAATEARNAEAREYNAQLHSALIDANIDNYFEAAKKDHYHKENVEKLTQYLAKAKLAVIMSENKERIFEEIKIRLDNFEIEEYDFIKADICLKGDIFRKETYIGVIDGSIKVSALSDGKEIGSSYVVLPWNGLNDKEIKLTTMIKCNEKIDGNIDFKFMYNDLWIIETFDK